VLQALWEERVDGSRAAAAAECRPERRPEHVPGAAGITTVRITVREVNAVLDVVAGLRPPPPGASRRAALVSLLGRACGLEVKWLVRILQRDVRIGARPTQP